ncbi:eukaryotic translation initiation factor 3 subunit A [Coniosporium apollinis]|uniref:Eukaryotic translation initiation factor 3 subunit A n=1 Tax=Coniosporium apollinis TaxID=61459 RepID=A0ABQ9NW07_9PEZI|nr:eukaryotic translation initiation factor 3 subunit A [Coniosporium apollinis]
MPPPPHSRPENVLKRAQELIGVGQSQAALSLLHEHVVSKRTRNSPIASLEPVMMLFVELCVDLRKGKLAKDGLYQYKNTAQNTNVGTIELVFKKFIELAEQKVTEAQAKADEVHAGTESTSTTNVEDLEATETPESILLSTVSGEQSRDRTDRAIVTPWLKFLWETYRTVLDIFKNNARLEVMYQSTAHQAFQFCSKYARKTEFRRLCELLRNHLQNAAKFSSQMHAINLSDPDTLQRHLDTRFQQLNVAVELELWQEAFRSVEDIHTLLSLSKRPAKNIMMANYFEKLTRIFLVSENYLFHAAAWSRYYNLMRQSAAAVASGQSPKKDNPAVSEADMTKAASFVLLSALAIPVISTSRSRGALVDVDEARKSKNVRLTNLLGMSQAPTRAILFKDALSKGLLKRARSEIRELYNILEVDFHPLSICKKISPILSAIGADADMQKYVQPLQQVILTRLFQQLSQVYESVELSFVMDLAAFPEPFQVNTGMIEKFIMNGCKKGDLAIRVDHATGVLTFDSDVFSSAKALHPGSGAGSAEAEAGSVQKLQSTPAEIVRSQLTRLAKTLYITCQYVDPTFNEDRQKLKAAALARAKAGAEKEHAETLKRREIIDRKKQAASSQLAAKQKEEETRKRLRAQQAQEAEAERLREEQKARDQRRIQAEQDRIKREEIERQLKELKTGTKGVDVESLDVSELDAGRIRAIKLAALEKEKNELSERLRITGKRIDHLERAFRREEIKHLPEDYAAQREQDYAAYEKFKADTLRDAEAKHKEDVALKHRLGRLVEKYEQFKKKVESERKSEFEKRRKAADKELQQKMDARRREYRERKARERREAEEAERRAREEEERLAREAEQKAREEEEKRERMRAEKEEREKSRREAEEAAARQRQREEEALARRKAAREAPTRVPERAPEPQSAPTESRGPPRLTLQPKGGAPPMSWREREALKKAGQSPAPTQNPTPAVPPADERVATAEVDLPRKTAGGSGYVPPHLREAGAKKPGAEDGAGGGWRSREASRRGESPAQAAGGRYQPPSRAGAGSAEPERKGYVPPSLRDREGVARDASPAAAGSGEERRDGGAERKTGGYVPPHLRGRRGE